MAVAENNLPTIHERIDQFGIGLSQVYMCLLAGFSGAHLFLISSVSHEVATDLSLSAYQQGMVVSIVFVGMLIGNLLSGPYGDLVGRKQPIIVSYACVTIFIVLSAYASGFRSLCIARFFIGFAIGMGTPACNSLLSEISPSSWRIVVLTCSGLLFVFGEAYSCVLILMDDASMQELEWRSLVLWGALPSLVAGILAVFFLIESPSFFATQGRGQEARDVLQFIRDTNGSHHDVDFKPPLVAAGKSMATRFELVFGPELGVTTCVSMYTCFMLNFIYYGTMYAFPQALPHLDSPHTAAVELLLGAMWELPGGILGIMVGMYMERKPSLKYYLFGVVLSLMLFLLGAQTRSDGLSRYSGHAVMAGFYGVKAFASVGFAIVYLYITEVFPTPARVTGSAVCIGTGRLAGIVAPVIFEVLLARTGHFNAFFAVTILLTLINFLLIDLLAYETFGVQLKDHMEDGKGASPCEEEGYGATSST